MALPKGNGGLQEPACRHADHLTGTDHQVIEHPHVNQTQGGDQLLSDAPIGTAWFGHTARMVVRQHDRAGIDGQGGSDDFAGMDAGAVNGAGKELLAIKNLVAVVEPEDVELFMEQCAQAHAEEVAGILRIADGALSFQFGSQEGFGGAEDVLFGDGAAGLVVALAILGEAHGVLPRRGIAPWAPVSEARNGGQHRNATAVR